MADVYFIFHPSTGNHVARNMEMARNQEVPGRVLGARVRDKASRVFYVDRKLGLESYPDADETAFLAVWVLPSGSPQPDRDSVPHERWWLRPTGALVREPWSENDINVTEIEGSWAGMGRDFAVNPWRFELTDDRGDRWQFRYTGGSLVRIYPMYEDGETGEMKADTQHTNGIDVNSWNAAGKVTTAWLGKRIRMWIKDRNKDLATGDYDRTGL
jgi:hypothetical protein